MASRKAPTLDKEIEMENQLDEELEDDMDDLDEMLENEMGEVFEASLTSAVPKKVEKYEGPRVRVFLQKLEDSGDEGVKVDQYEHVTLANEKGETCYKVLRGEWVDIPVPVFLALKERYPKL